MSAAIGISKICLLLMIFCDCSAKASFCVKNVKYFFFNYIDSLELKYY